MNVVLWALLEIQAHQDLEDLLVHKEIKGIEVQKELEEKDLKDSEAYQVIFYLQLLLK